MNAAAEKFRTNSGVWHGQLGLVFSRAGDRTVLEARRATMPLAIQRPFYPEDPRVCHALILHPPGGMVAGDHLEIDITLGNGAWGVISTPSAGKWYRGAAPARLSVVARVGRDAALEWLPQESIVFDGANARQSLRVELAPGACWCGWDIVRFGRSARGERFTNGAWRSDIEVWRGSQPLWVDRQRLDPGSGLVERPYGLGGAPVVGGMAWIGRPVSPALIESARRIWQDNTRAGEAGVTRLPEGMLCRYRGPSSAEARGWFTSVWDLLRREHLGRPAPAMRIWST
ncbi:MAG: urease accessory protein UreD [Sulfuricaulis sp.]|nr:urease accessory protein UreD [Sulfuricaulis sp.]